MAKQLAKRPIFAEYYARLRQWLPTKRPLRVLFVPESRLHDEHGFEVWGDYSNGTIRISESVSDQQAVDVLIHEVAHHLSRRKRHGPKFWDAHGRCYRALFGE